MQMRKVFTYFFLLFSAFLFVSSSFAATPETTSSSHAISVHKHRHSERTGKGIFLLSDIHTERSIEEYTKRLALLRLSIGNNMLIHQLKDDLLAACFFSSSCSVHSNHLYNFGLSHIYPFHFFW